MRKLNKLMEHFWLAVAIGTGISAAYVIFTDGFQAGKQWLWFPGIALAMFIFRRITRRRLEAMDDRHQERRQG